MKRLNTYYYICERGHLTVGNSNTQKTCEGPLVKMKWVKPKRKGSKWTTEDMPPEPCDAAIISVYEVPEELTFSKEWDDKQIKAFLMGQKSEEFVGLVQKEFLQLRSKIQDLERKIECQTTDTPKN